MAKKSDVVFNTVYEPHLNPGRRSSGSQQQQIQWMLERTLIEYAMNRFEWKGLPEEIDVRWLEMAICFHGLSVFFYDNKLGKHLALPGAGTGSLNLLGQPTEYVVYGNNYYPNRTIPQDDVVPIWGNYTRIPDMDKIQIYAARIAQMDRTIEINSLNARRTKVMTMTENGRLTAENVNRQVNEGAAVISVAQGYDVQQSLGNIDLGVDPRQIIDMDVARERQWTTIMGLLGINNANQDKKERLVAAEVSGNDDIIATARASNLNARQQACKEIKKKFGFDVEVDYVTDMKTAELTDNTNPDAGAAISEGAAS